MDYIRLNRAVSLLEGLRITVLSRIKVQQQSCTSFDKTCTFDRLSVRDLDVIKLFIFVGFLNHFQCCY